MEESGCDGCMAGDASATKDAVWKAASQRHALTDCPCWFAAARSMAGWMVLATSWAAAHQSERCVQPSRPSNTMTRAATMAAIKLVVAPVACVSKSSSPG